MVAGVPDSIGHLAIGTSDESGSIASAHAMLRTPREGNRYLGAQAFQEMRIWRSLDLVRVRSNQRRGDLVIYLAIYLVIWDR